MDGGHCFVCTKEVDFHLTELSDEFLLMVQILDLPEHVNPKEKLTCIYYCSTCLDKIRMIQMTLAQLVELEEQIFRAKLEIESNLKNIACVVPAGNHRSDGDEKPALDFRSQVSAELKSRAIRAILSNLRKKSKAEGFCSAPRDLIRIMKKSRISKAGSHSSLNNITNNSANSVQYHGTKSDLFPISHQSATEPEYLQSECSNATGLQGYGQDVTLGTFGEGILVAFEDIEYKPCLEDPQDPIGITSTESELSSKESFICGSCGQVVGDYEQLVAHDPVCCSRNKSANATDDATKPPRDPTPYGFRCNICYRTFMKQNALTIHSRRHTPHFCKICGKHYVSSGGLLSHQRRTHTVNARVEPVVNEKPFECKTCGVAYRKSSDLSSHMQMHKRLEGMDLIV